MTAFVCLVALHVFGAARADTRPVSEVWPYQAKRLPDGKFELSYDLTGLKQGILDTEAASELDEPSLKALAGKLPKEAKVILDSAGAPLNLSVATARERAPPAVSFADVSSSALAATTPLEQKAGARILPALHPTMPKLWVSLDATLWKARHANESIVGGILLAADDGKLGAPMGARAFWQAVVKAALNRAAQSEGDPQEGALALASHISAALKRQGVAVPSVLAKSERWNETVEELLDQADRASFGQATTLRSTFSPALLKLEQRDRLLAMPLPDDRRGKAAALTFLVLLENDAKLNVAYLALQRVRDTFVGKPRRDELSRWQTLAKEQGGAAASVDDLGEYLAKAQQAKFEMPALFALGDTPIEVRLDETGGRAQESARDDLVVALQEGRVSPATLADTGFLAHADWAFAAAISNPEDSDRPRVHRLRAYRDRVSAAFTATLPAPSLEVDSDSRDGAEREDRRAYGLRVALKVPPVLAVEPSPVFFARLSKVYEQLEKQLSSTFKARTVSGVLPGGAKRSANNKVEALRLKRLYRGLALLIAGAAAANAEDKESLKSAEVFVAKWRGDPDLSADVRFAAVLSGDGQLLVYGVGRQELRVGWEVAPRATVSGKHDPALLVVDTNAAQHYVTPVLMTGQPHYPGTLPDRAAFRAISDRAKRDPARVDASLSPGP